jgi:hypothetical protein
MENLGSRLCSTPVITTFSCPSLGIRLITPPYRHPTISCPLHLCRRLLYREITPCIFVHLPIFLSVRTCSTDKRCVRLIEYLIISLTSLPPPNLLSFFLPRSPHIPNCVRIILAGRFHLRLFASRCLVYCFTLLPLACLCPHAGPPMVFSIVCLNKRCTVP